MSGEGIEEWIMELLNSKLRTIRQVVDGVEAGRGGYESIFSYLVAKSKGKMGI
jgi:hypothetical protein